MKREAMNEKLKNHNSLFTIHNSRKSAGFTLLEILIVMGIIAILAAVMIITLDPVSQFAKSRNTERWNDINNIMDAVYRYNVENTGSFPSTITSTQTEICKEGVISSTCSTAGLISLILLTTNDKYLPEIPADPSCPTACNASGAGYTISKSGTNIITVTAPDAELGETISISR